MVISKSNIQIIEKHLSSYYEYVEREKNNVEDIIYSNRSVESIGAQSGKHSDITADRALKLYCYDSEEKKWIRVINKVIEKFRGTTTFDVIQKRYFQKKSILQVQEELHIEKSTAYRYKDDIILYTAMVAIQEGLINI